ncbi:MAG TPA: lysylphosphatidylglycerol synthase transmembrane domain-containing protein [Gaiellaceae bacterium]|nr:lysylphosphatidylglycerol synthase transmembrane domain-containing protein [Gaiellaceae bacterium]
MTDRERQPRAISAAFDLEGRNFLILVIAGALALAAAMGLADMAGYTHLVEAVQDVVPTWFAVCFGGQVLAYFGYVLAVRDIAYVDRGTRLPFRLTMRSVVAGFGVFAATHAAGGFAVDYWTFRRSGLRRREAVARVLALGALEYAVLAPAALICAVVLLFGTGGHVQHTMTYPWLAVVPGFLAALWVSSPKRAGRLSDPGDGGRIRQWFAHAVAGIVKLRCLLARPHVHGLGVVGVSLYWLGDIACLWAALKIYNAELSTPALVVAYATGYVATRRSLPLGGAGVVEVLMTLALVWVGVGIAPALLGVVTYRFFNFWLPVIPALAALPAVQRMRQDLRRAERALDKR